MNIDQTTWRAARRGLEKAVALYLNDPNVSLIDIGFRRRGRETELVVRVHVRRKLYGEAFRKFAAEQPHRVIDAQRVGFAIDVVEADYQLQLRHESLQRDKSRSQRNGGSDIANAVTCSLGISGGKVRDRRNGEELILSSWHVLAGLCSAGASTQIRASNDGPKIAEYIRGGMHAGLDAAVARLCGHENFPAPHREIGEVTGVMIPQLGMRVRKTGGNTGVVSGIITGVLGYAKRSYAGINCVIGPNIHIAPEEAGMPICAEGDSGAWWQESSSSRAVALHFAGSGIPNFALALPMPNVLEALEVDLIPLSSLPSSLARPAKSATTLVKRDATRQLQALADEAIITTEAEILSEEELPVLAERVNSDLLNQTREKILRLRTNESKEKAALQLGFIRRTQSIRWAAHSYGLLSVKQLFLVLSFLWMAATGFHNYLLTTQRHQQDQLETVRLHMREIQAIAKLDSLRELDLQKITSFIERFNPEMRADIKFTVAVEIEAMRRKYPHLNLELICATITHESAWNAEAVSPAGAMGLMQIMPATGIYLSQEENLEWTSAEQILFNPIYNIRLGCRYLAGLVETYGIEAGLAGYNGGERCAEIWQRKGTLPRETVFYVPSILKIYRNSSGGN